MSRRALILLALSGAISAVSAAGADGPVAAVRAQRTASNDAIAAHDAGRLRVVLADDYLGIQGTSGELDSGGDATARSYGDAEFKDPTFVTYRRTPSTVALARSGKRVAETGRWQGIWHKADGAMRKTGLYLAVWIPVGETWRLKSETFVTLSCTGSKTCDAQG